MKKLGDFTAVGTAVISKVPIPFFDRFSFKGAVAMMLGPKGTFITYVTCAFRRTTTRTSRSCPDGASRFPTRSSSS